MITSALTYADLANYLKIESEDIDPVEQAVLTGFLSAAKTYAAGYTGLTAAELDEHEDIAIAVLCLAGDFYTNRDMYTVLKGTGNNAVNRTVQSILDMHARNLIPVEPVEEEDDDVQP